jgi:hypothetical protein
MKIKEEKWRTVAATAATTHRYTSHLEILQRALYPGFQSQATNFCAALHTESGPKFVAP